MKRNKYEPRVGKNHGAEKIKDSWLKETFGPQYNLYWNGHSHFAIDTKTGLSYYIFKKDKRLVPTQDFWRY